MGSNNQANDQPQDGFEEDQLKLIQTMFDQAPVCMAATEGPDHRILYINPAFRRVLGNIDFPSGTPARQILPDLKAENELEIQSALQRFDQAYNTGEPFIGNEFRTLFDRHRSGDLDKTYFNWVYQPLKDQWGEVYGLFIAGYEVTDHVEARQEKTHSQKRLRLALEGAQVGFWESDLRTNTIEFTSRQCKAHFGLAPYEELSYEDFLDMVHPDDREQVLHKRRKAIETNCIYNAEYRVIWPDDSVHWLTGRGQCLYDEDDQPYRFIGVTVDITQHKLSQEDLKEAVSLRDNFLSIASHELKTPVTSMKTRAQLVERQLRDEGYRDYADQLQKINNDIDQLTILTGNLLDISQLRKEGLAMEKHTFPLSDLIEEIVEMLQPVSHHTIETDGLMDCAPYADRNRIGQVLTNLLENAIKYSPEADKVVVRCHHEEDEVIISVVDCGIGISDKEKQSIFKRFYKGGGKNKNTFPGFGIGLFISTQIIEHHGGDIWVEDNGEQGSIFSFSLPMAA